METTTREMTFEEESALYEKEARAEFAKETGNCDGSKVNNILRRGMRIIRKARQEIARHELVRCKDCVNYCGFEHCKNGICDLDSVSKRAVYPNDFCSYGERRE